ncbi:MAG: hypothetical protein ABL994_16720 [Verrucomicrobiales bacterium]
MGGNNEKPTRVKDPIMRALMGIAVALATWALSQVQGALVQVQDHSRVLSTISAQVRHLEDSVVSVERRSGKITDDLHRDIREIRTILERKQ